VAKKSHTAKSFIISTKDKQIRYISRSFVGRAHDYSILKAELPPEQNWFQDFEVRLDLGYIGFKDDYKCAKAYLPYKRKHKTELTEEQKESNKTSAKERITVEHCIGGIKRFRILSERLRVHDFNTYDTILGVCAALWNFYLTH
jgi:hypothetical protein